MNASCASFVPMAGVLCMVIGWGFSLVGVSKLHEATHASAKPTEITCSQLRSYRPGSNTHIALTKFRPYLEGAVIYSETGRLPGSVWVPLLPADAPKADPKYIVAVVQLPHMSDEAAVRRALARTRLTGLLHSRGDLPYAAKIREFNPGVNLEQCWSIWEGHQPEKMDGAIPLLIGCPCLFVLGASYRSWPRRVRAASDSGLPPVLLIFSPLFSGFFEGLRWIHRLGLSPGRLAVLLTAVGLAAIGTAGFVLYRDWDNVVTPTGGMLAAVTGGLIGLGLLANAVFVGYAGGRTDPFTPAPAPDLPPFAQTENIPSDMRQKATAVMVFAASLLAGLGVIFYQDDSNSPRLLVLLAIGGLMFIGGAVWYGLLRWKGRQEKAQFWNQPGA